jgi:hypothetical protein
MQANDRSERRAMTVQNTPKQLGPARYIWAGPDLSEARSLC